MINPQMWGHSEVNDHIWHADNIRCIPRLIVLFQTQPELAVSVFIQLRRRDPSEENASLETLALHLQSRYFPEMSSLLFKPVAVTDFEANSLQGLQRHITQNGIQT
ncbi:MAG: hypothetical protein MUO64_10720 [Anaerolineales bacterium]|nr:hypothetical protein [Anaerolineales bacterium]